MSLIIPANTLASGGYAVDNSLRFNDGSTDYLSISGSTPSNSKKFTYSLWVKRCTLGADQELLSYETDANNRGGIELQSDDSFRYFERVGGSNTILIETNRLFRDVSAWYHIIVAVDTTQGTDTNRVKIYVNGVQETSFSSSTYPSLNSDTRANGTSNKNIGRRNVNGDFKFDGYLAEVVFVDETQQANTDLGEFDSDSGIWKPIDVSGLTFGTNGFYLDFEDSAALGDDVSGNGNDFTVNNLTAIDQTTDTPTNNFATLNPLVPATSVGFSNGNLTFTGSREGNWSSVVSTFALSSGKWYAEFKINSSSGLKIVGVEPAENISDYNDNHVGHTVDGRGYEDSNGYLNTNGSSSSWGATYGNGDIIGVALDMDNRYVYFSKNGTFQNSGNPTSGSSGTGSAGSQLASKEYYFGLSGHASGGNTVIESNFGNPSFTGTDQADGNSYGSFEYSVPSGYLALNTKNLSEVLS